MIKSKILFLLVFILNSLSFHRFTRHCRKNRLFINTGEYIQDIISLHPEYLSVSLDRVIWNVDYEKLHVKHAHVRKDEIENISRKLLRMVNNQHFSHFSVHLNCSLNSFEVYSDRQLQRFFRLFYLLPSKKLFVQIHPSVSEVPVLDDELLTINIERSLKIAKNKISIIHNRDLVKSTNCSPNLSYLSSSLLMNVEETIVTSPSVIGTEFLLAIDLGLRSGFAVYSKVGGLFGIITESFIY